MVVMGAYNYEGSRDFRTKEVKSAATLNSKEAASEESGSEKKDWIHLGMYQKFQ